MQKVAVLDRHGKSTGVWKFDGKNANQALHLMGKDRGMFVDKVEVVNPDQETEGGGLLGAGGGIAGGILSSSRSSSGRRSRSGSICLSRRRTTTGSRTV